MIFGKKKVCIAAMLLALGCSIAAVPVMASDNLVYDNADLLSDSDITTLNTEITQAESKTSWSIIAVSTDDAQGKSSQTYGEECFNSYATSDDGVVLLIDMDNREYTIVTTGNAVLYLTDERIDGILDDAYDDLSEEDYLGTYETMLDGVTAAYDNGIVSNQNTYNNETGERDYYHEKQHGFTFLKLLIALAIGIAVGGITAGAIVGKYRLKWGTYKYSFRENGHVDLTRKEDRFVNQIITHHHIQKDPPSGGNGTSTIHTGAGGRDFGGGSHKF